MRLRVAFGSILALFAGTLSAGDMKVGLLGVVPALFVNSLEPRIAGGTKSSLLGKPVVDCVSSFYGFCTPELFLRIG